MIEVWNGPFGTMTLAGDARGLTHALWTDDPTDVGESRDDEGVVHLEQARREISEYAAGARRAFGVRLAAAGTPFQRGVWSELARIPWGETVSYGELARRVGRPGAVRAVGAASARNPISILLPCHRVIGSDGRLTGYAGGLTVKEALLRLELSEAG